MAKMPKRPRPTKFKLEEESTLPGPKPMLAIVNMVERYGPNLETRSDYRTALTTFGLKEKQVSSQMLRRAETMVNSQNHSTREARYREMRRVNMDPDIAMYCFEAWHPELDPDLNDRFLDGVHPTKHGSVLRDYPHLAPFAPRPAANRPGPPIPPGAALPPTKARKPANGPLMRPKRGSKQSPPKT